MKALKIDRSPTINRKLLSIDLAKNRYVLGRDSLLKLAAEAQAIVWVGRRRLINADILDRYLDTITGE